MKALLYTIGLTLIAHSISSTAHAALHLDFPTDNITNQANGYIGGHYGNLANFNEWLGSSATEAAMIDGVLETKSTSPSFRGAAIVFEASSFDGAGDYTLNFDVNHYIQGSTLNDGIVSIWSGSGYDLYDSPNALIVENSSSSGAGTLTTKGSAISAELASLTITSTGSKNITFTYDGSSAVAFFFGTVAKAWEHPEANFANINVTGLQVIPESSTYALILGLATVSVVFGRRRRS